MSLSTLVHAINNANTEELRDTLLKIIASGDTGKSVVSKGLEEPWPEPTVRPPMNKRVIAWKECRRCEQKYDAAKNTRNSCVYHFGELEVNDEWKGLIAGEEDRLYTETNIETHPEWFAWFCCERPPGAVGCFRNSHSDSGKEVSPPRPEAVKEAAGQSETRDLVYRKPKMRKHRKGGSKVKKPAASQSEVLKEEDSMQEGQKQGSSQPEGKKRNIG